MNETFRFMFMSGVMMFCPSFFGNGATLQWNPNVMEVDSSAFHRSIHAENVALRSQTERLITKQGYQVVETGSD